VLGSRRKNGFTVLCPQHPNKQDTQSILWFFSFVSGVAYRDNDHLGQRSRLQGWLVHSFKHPLKFFLAVLGLMFA
jgi:hypothetical protein